MAAATAPLFVGCLLLVLGGAPKVVAPTNTVGALRSVGARVPPGVIRLGGALETALGIATLLTGSRVLAAFVALSYAGFSGFLLVALRRGGAVSSCGCVGRADTPPTRAHVVVTGTLAITAAFAAGLGATGLLDLDATAQSLTALALVALSTWLGWLALAVLPRLTALRLTARES